MESALKQLKSKETYIAIVGLGYVGLPLAQAFSKHFSVIGFDVDEKKIASYSQGYDSMGETISEEILFTADATMLSASKYIIISVPTPIYGDKRPDLEPLRCATATVGRNLSQGSTVIYESTVYPGVTEEICLPILERESGLKCISDFKLGYSPERINPGDHINRLENIVKIVSGIDNETLDEMVDLYETIVKKVYPAPSIQVAEAAKLAENAQRDINIAFMNELATVFHLMDINTGEVIKAMNTKWNALGFYPGLVGGHCIGVDPYYFIYRAQNLGYYSQLISVGRRINDGMSDFVVQETLRLMIKSCVNISASRVFLMGMTFKENCPDTRNSRAIDIYHKFENYGISTFAVDPLPDKKNFSAKYGISLTDVKDVCEADCLVFLVAHDGFRNLGEDALIKMYRRDIKKCILIDIKGIFSSKILPNRHFIYWSL